MAELINERDELTIRITLHGDHNNELYDELVQVRRQLRLAEQALAAIRANGVSGEFLGGLKR